MIREHLSYATGSPAEGETLIYNPQMARFPYPEMFRPPRFDSQLELFMDDCVRSNLFLNTKVERKQGGTWIEVTSQQDLDIGIDYRLILSCRNMGSEISFKNIEIRCFKRSDSDLLPSRITFYDTFEVEPVPPKNSKSVSWEKILPPGAETEKLEVLFRVVTDPDTGTQFRLAHVGVYAEIVPVGHAWRDINWKY